MEDYSTDVEMAQHLLALIK